MSVLRLTDEQYAAAQKRARKAPQTDTGRAFPASGVQTTRSKYNSRACGSYSSGREARRAAELKLRLAAGEITELEEQVAYVLIPTQHDENGKVIERECRYLCDFRYRENGKLVVEDVKSEPTKTPAYRIKRKLLLMVHGIRIREVT